MKKLIFTLFLACCVLSMYGQQDRQNTQFFYYKQGYNPGYVGSNEATCITCLHRSQWMGLEGAPTFTTVSANIPLFNQRVGAGINIERYEIGLFTNYTMDGIYSYRIRMGQGTLGMGVQASVRSVEGRFQNAEATENVGIDPSVSGMQQNKFVANFGAGLYYSSPKFYAGFSLPRFLNNNIDFGDESTEISREVNHFYLMGGVVFDIGENLQLQPQTLIKYVPNAPVDADANVNLIINNAYTFGVTYRLGGDRVSGLGESVDVLLSAQLTKNLLFGMSYDITISDLRDYQSGSIEGSLHYCFGKSEGEEYVNPRFF